MFALEYAMEQNCIIIIWRVSKLPLKYTAVFVKMELVRVLGNTFINAIQWS